MIDAGFTYAGHVLGFVAIGLWAWLACTAPALQAWILSRYEDELQFGAPRPVPAPTLRAAGMSQVAYGVAMVAILCQSIALAIPD